MPSAVLLLLLLLLAVQVVDGASRWGDRRVAVVVKVAFGENPCTTIGKDETKAVTQQIQKQPLDIVMFFLKRCPIVLGKRKNTTIIFWGVWIPFFSPRFFLPATIITVFVAIRQKVTSAVSLLV